MATLVVAAACGSEDDPTPAGAGMGGYAGFVTSGGAAGMVGTGSTPVVGQGGIPTNTGGIIGAGGGPNGGIPNAGGGPETGGFGGVIGTGGFPPSDGGAPPSGGTPGTGGSPPTGTDAKIPEPQGECPVLRSGTQTIMGLSTVIQAGTASPGRKGPLLFNWHGTGSNGSQAMFQVAAISGAITGEGGMIIAATDNGQVREGRDVTGVLGVWYDVGDLKFADQIVACAVKNHNIDPNRIYVTGCSAGGLMTGTMMFRRSSYIAAGLPNSGGGGGQPDNPNHIPPVMCMHGGANDNVIINFGDSSRALENTVKARSLAIDCDHTRGHCASPGDLYSAGWTFLKAHPYNVGTSPYKASGLPAGFPSYCKIVQ